ncbi:MAG TPA: hypothetical protein VFW22_01260 [Pseudolabrys sp.]|nr:hypothetical protein [Pseudolabrys sp.]
MDKFFSFMTGDTSVFGFTFHNWLVALAGVAVIWGTVLLKDL